MKGTDKNIMFWTGLEPRTFSTTHARMRRSQLLSSSNSFLVREGTTRPVDYFSAAHFPFSHPAAVIKAVLIAHYGERLRYRPCPPLTRPPSLPVKRYLDQITPRVLMNDSAAGSPNEAIIRCKRLSESSSCRQLRRRGNVGSGPGMGVSGGGHQCRIVRPT